MRLFCSPTFDLSSNDQASPSWPAPGGISEGTARSRCRAVIVNENVIGQDCFDKLGDGDTADNIVQTCIDDVQVITLFDRVIFAK